MTAFTDARDFLLRHRGDYAAAYAGFRWPVLEEFNWALDYFDVMARNNDAVALQIVGADGTQITHSFHELSLSSAQVACHLRHLGVRRGDRLLLMLGNEVPLWEVSLACFKLGAVLIPASTLLTAADLGDRLRRGNVRHVVAGSAHTEKFAGLAEALTRISVGPSVPGWRRFEDAVSVDEVFLPDRATRADDPLLAYFTSGTTSAPKLVIHSHQSYPVGHLSTMYWIGLKPGDLHMNISSPGWAKHAWSSLFAPWNAEAGVFIFNYERFKAPQLLSVLESHRVTSVCAPPTVWRLLVQEDLAAYRGRLNLRELVGAGEPLNPQIIEQIRGAWQLPLRDGYGQTETTALIGNTVGQEIKAGSMGRPLPGYRIALLDEEGNPSTQGELCLDLSNRPVGLMQAYDGSAPRDAPAPAVYHRTGDTAMQDADGYVTFIGRADDVFKSSDYRISPFELESALIEHESVTEAAVVPAPDALRLAVPKAYVILAEGARAGPELAQALFAFCRRQLAAYKRVRRIEFVTELPKTISGKIRRVQLRAQEAERQRSNIRGSLEFWEEDFSSGNEV